MNDSNMETKNTSILTPYCESTLKQQCLGESGLYRWEDKKFRLHVKSGILEVFPRNEDTKQYESNPTVMSFSGAKHAKEWSLTTPAIGSFGFDVVWDSGRIWSFLASDMVTCRNWVEAINDAISFSSAETSRVANVATTSLISDTKLSSTTPLKSASHASKVDVSMHANREQDTTLLETHTPGPIHVMNSRDTNQATTERYRTYFNNTEIFPSPPTQQSIKSDRGKSSNVHHNSSRPHFSTNTANTVGSGIGGSLNISAIPLVPSSDGSPESCPESKDENASTTSDKCPVEPYRIDMNLDELRSRHELRPTDDNRNFGELKKVSKSSVENVSSQSSEEIQRYKDEIKILKQQQRQLESTNEELQNDFETARQQLKELKADSSKRCSEMERQLARAQENQIKNSLQHSHGLEQAVIQAQSDSHKMHEASNRSLKEQHHREVLSLQDELAEERKKFGNLLLHEKKHRSQAESKEAELRINFSNLIEEHAAMQKQLEEEKAEFRAAKNSWEREKLEIQRSSEAKLRKVVSEKDQIIFEAQEKARKKVDVVSSEFQSSIKNMEVRLLLLGIFLCGTY